jgi:hypothetical protein
MKTPNSMRSLGTPGPPSDEIALFAGKNSDAYKNGTGISYYISRIRFIAHTRVVTGRAVANVTSEGIGKRITP